MRLMLRETDPSGPSAARSVDPTPWANQQRATREPFVGATDPWLDCAICFDDIAVHAELGWGTDLASCICTIECHHDRSACAGPADDDQHWPMWDVIGVMIAWRHRALAACEVRGGMRSKGIEASL